MEAVSPETDNRVAKAIQQVTQIATLPEVTAKIIQVVEDPHSTARDLQVIIKHDVALSAKILKVVNSAFYGLPRQVSSVERAIILLGLSTVKNIAVATSVSKLFRGPEFSKRMTSQDLWRHSLACGVFGKLIAEQLKLFNADEFFVGGLMHDLGIIVEKQVFPKDLGTIIDKAIDDQRYMNDVETEVLGADHQVFGTSLATKWKFPHLFQLATGYHHQPLKASEQYHEFTSVIHLADVLAMKKQIGFNLPKINFIPETVEILGLTEEQIGEIYEVFDAKYEEAGMVLS